MRLRRLAALPVLLVPLLLAAGCSEGDGTAGATPSPSGSGSPSGTGDAAETEAATSTGGPVAGSGSTIPSAKADRWCGAISPEQLAAATGFEVSEVTVLGQGLTTCDAGLPGSELSITWGAERTRKTQEQYAQGWTRPTGVFEITDLTLTGGQQAVVASAPSPRSATAGFVAGGRLVQAQVITFGSEEGTDDDALAAIAEAIVAVYAA